MANERGLTYVKLDGDIGILGNGAGLVMSTLDVVAQAGGKPAMSIDDDISSRVASSWGMKPVDSRRSDRPNSAISSDSSGGTRPTKRTLGRSRGPRSRSWARARHSVARSCISG
jgi:hypothetical protein